MKNQSMDPVYLKQKIIYLQSELSRYKGKLKEYQKSYQYNMLESLKEENADLHFTIEKLKEERKTLLQNIEVLEREKSVRNEIPIIKPNKKRHEGRQMAARSDLRVNKQREAEKYDSWFLNNLKNQL